MVARIDGAATLGEGDRGEDVRTLQELLAAHGRSLATDGVFGSQTRRELESFQADTGLEVTGTTTPTTWGRLVVTVREGDRGVAVRAVQRRIGVTPDGVFGAGTRGAVEQFQSAHRLDADGIVGSKTWQALLRVEGTPASPTPAPTPTPEPTSTTDATAPTPEPIPRTRSPQATAPDPAIPAGAIELRLAGSVGRGGSNRSEDVIAVKQRLVDLGYDWLTADADVDAETIATIRLFQSIVAGRHSVGGDGRIDVDRSTHRWLRARNAPRWTRQPVGSPTGSEGYYNVEVAEQHDDDHDYGTDWLARTLRDAGRAYQDRYRTATPSSPPITVNDAARPRGGDTPDHAGHETGLSADLRLPRTDGGAGGITVGDEGYDRDAMRAMLRAIREQPMVSRILFNDPELVDDGLCTRHAGHDDHAHVEIAPRIPDVHGRTLNATYERAIADFGGSVVDPTGYPMTVDGFARYLDDTGVEHFTASEMTTPNHRDVAARLGYEVFLPPHGWWPRGAALALLADRLRDLVAESVAMRNWYRPQPYNDHPTVGGSTESDHIIAAGVDLDYRSAAAYSTAVEELRRLQRTEPWLELSLGEYGRATHVGIASPNGQRTWRTTGTDGGTTVRPPDTGSDAPHGPPDR